MTATEISTMLSYLIADPDGTRYTSAQRLDLVNIAMKAIMPLIPSSLLWPMVVSINLNSSEIDDGWESYAGNDPIARILAIYRKGVPARRLPIGWEAVNPVKGTAESPAYTIQSGILKMQPVLETTDIATIHFVRMPVTITGGTECPFPPDFHPMVAEYAAYLAYMGDGESGSAQLHYAKVIEGIGRLG